MLHQTPQVKVLLEQGKQGSFAPAGVMMERRCWVSSGASVGPTSSPGWRPGLTKRVLILIKIHKFFSKLARLLSLPAYMGGFLGIRRGYNTEALVRYLPHLPDPPNDTKFVWFCHLRKLCSKQKASSGGEALRIGC